LAFEAHDLFYEIQDLNFAFLSLMIGLEALFSSEVGELSYRISRCTVILLGKNRAESEEIYTNIKKLYRIRLDLIHRRGFKVNYEIIL